MQTFGENPISSRPQYEQTDGGHRKNRTPLARRIRARLKKEFRRARVGTGARF